MYLCFAIVSLLGMVEPFQAQADQIDTSMSKKREQIRVLPVQRTPESNSIILKMSIPKKGEVISENPVSVQFRIEDYALGVASSQFDRSEEIAISDLGQTVHVIVDNNPYIPISEQAVNPFNEEGNFRITRYYFNLPDNLSDGMHTLRLFPARSYGESIKGSNTFLAINFYVGEKKEGDVNLSKPYLTYNEPSNELPLNTNQPILLDFLVSNCELTPDGYKVRLSIDGVANRMLTSWQPYYIYGLPRGTHTIRLELLDRAGTLVPGPFNDTQRTIRVN